MIVFIILTVVSIYLVLTLRRVVVDTQRTVVGKIVEYTKPVEVLKGLAGSVAGNMLIKLKESFSNR